MPPNDDGKLSVSATVNPLIRENALQISSSSLLGNLEENNKDECYTDLDKTMTTDNHRYTHIDISSI